MNSCRQAVAKHCLWLILPLVFCVSVLAAGTTTEAEEKETPERYHIAVFDWPHVDTPYTVSLWILLASIAKIGSFLFPFE